MINSTPPPTSTVAATRHAPKGSPKTTAPITAPTMTLDSRSAAIGASASGLGPQHEHVGGQREQATGAAGQQVGSHLTPQHVLSGRPDASRGQR